VPSQKLWLEDVRNRKWSEIVLHLAQHCRVASFLLDCKLTVDTVSSVSKQRDYSLNVLLYPVPWFTSAGVVYFTIDIAQILTSSVLRTLVRNDTLISVGLSALESILKIFLKH
jgi:hypothetical protein